MKFNILFTLKCFFGTCLIHFPFSVIADEGREVQAIGLLDLSKYKIFPDCDNQFILHRDELPPCCEEDDLFHVPATPPVKSPYISAYERKYYRKMANKWQSKGRRYTKSAAKILNKLYQKKAAEEDDEIVITDAKVLYNMDHFKTNILCIT